MDWSIAQAKQQFSEVVRLAAAEPQAIYNRSTPVAMLVGADEFEQFKRWKARRAAPPLADSFGRLRAELTSAGLDGIDIEPRPIEGRPNSFEQMLDEEYGAVPPPTAPARKARARGAR
jgi:prevent-host-death family protein